MPRITIAAALALTLAAPAPAQETAPIMPGDSAFDGTEPGVIPEFLDEIAPGDLRASTFIGRTVYLAEGGVEEATPVSSPAAWTETGEVADLVLNRFGDIRAVLVDTGGKTIGLPMRAVRLIDDSDAPGEFFIVLVATRDQIEAAPEVETAGLAEADTAPDPGPALDMTALTAEEIAGARVVDPEGRQIGTVSQVLTDVGGRPTSAVVDVGGFLGLGAKPVALDLDMLSAEADVETGGLRLRAGVTEAELMAMTAYEG